MILAAPVAVTLDLKAMGANPGPRPALGQEREKSGGQ